MFCGFFVVVAYFLRKINKDTLFCPGESLDLPAAQATFLFSLENIHLLHSKEEHVLVTVMAEGLEANIT